jgi:hypothetical protein
VNLSGNLLTIRDIVHNVVNQRLRALALGTRSYTSVAAIMNNRQDRKRAETELLSLFHENIRGPGYYH